MTKRKKKTDNKSIRGTGGKYYKRARLLYHNTDVGKTVVMVRDSDALGIRVALYKYTERQGYVRLFRTQTRNGNLIIKRIL